jgi:antitoxin VapB
MMTAKLFKSGGSQAVRLPKALRFKGTEVIVERIGDNVLLRPKVATFGDVIREMHQKFPKEHDFPMVLRPKHHERPILEW